MNSKLKLKTLLIEKGVSSKTLWKLQFLFFEQETSNFDYLLTIFSKFQKDGTNFIFNISQSKSESESEWFETIELFNT